MSGISLFIFIAIAVILAFILYKIFKPYFLRYDTTLLITGGLGSGKSLTTIKTAIVLIRKQRFYKYYCYNYFCVKRKNWWLKIFNFFRSKKNKHRIKKGKEEKPLFKYATKRVKPKLYSNIPIHFKTHIFGRNREWAEILNERHLLCLERQREYSVVVIDELPQFINQFNWNQDLVQKNVNEYITFFRHYVGGYFLTNAQSVDDVVVQIRRKLNQATWCFDFKKHLFGLFYTIRMCDIMLSDQVSTMSTTMIDENTRLHFGLFPKKGTYDTRCYSERYKNTLLKCNHKYFAKVKTNKVLRLQDYISPLDDKTTLEQKQEQLEKANRLTRSMTE